MEQTQHSKLSSEIEEKQMMQLRAQIMAYKHLIRNIPLPPEIERTILQPSRDQWELERERMFCNSLKFYSEKVEKQDEFKALLRERMTKRSSE